MNCLIVDDELLAQEIIEHYITRVDFLFLKGKCNSAMDAFKKLHTEKIDLIFLDIKMPEISGLDFLRSLKNPPMVILTTAFHEFAIESYELNVIDYLLKPISYDRFLKGVNKANDSIMTMPTTTEFYVKSNRSIIKINPRDILYIEGLKNYLIVHTNTKDKKLITHSTFKSMELSLEAFSYFCRIHKSYIVNTQHITKVESNTVIIAGVDIPISITYKDAFWKRFKK